MAKRLYVGNLPYTSTEEEIRERVALASWRWSPALTRPSRHWIKAASVDALSRSTKHALASSALRAGECRFYRTIRKSPPGLSPLPELPRFSSGFFRAWMRCLPAGPTHS